MFHLAFSSKGFVFVVEALIAFVIFASFLQVASYDYSSTENMIHKVSEKQYTNNAISLLDNNGYILNIIDSSALSADGKMDALASTISSFLSVSKDYRLELRVFDGNAAPCISTLNFSDCFTELYLFPAKGSVLPADKSVSHERFVFVNRERPQQCQVGAVFSEDELLETEVPPPLEVKKNVASFSAPRLFFAETTDLNIYFDVTVTPPDEASCGDTIRVDLEAYVPDYSNLYGRAFVDMMMVVNISEQMEQKNVRKGDYASGTISDGTYNIDLGSCNTLGNWQDLGTVVVDSTLEGEEVDVNLSYTGYAGACNYPALRLVKGGTYYPAQDGLAEGSPITVTLNNIDAGTYTIQGWSDEEINYDLNVSVKKFYGIIRAARTFNELADWIRTGNPKDQIGLVSFDDVAIVKNRLNADDSSVDSALKNLGISNPYANTAGGIEEARLELFGNKGNADSVKFMILFSDGKTNYGGDVMAAAQTAADQGVYIYTVGFGNDANDEELQQIADISGATYYKLDDEENLDELIDFLSRDIGGKAVGIDPEVVLDSNLLIPVDYCYYFTNTSSGECVKIGDQNYLYYEVGQITNDQNWTDFFEMVIPCDIAEACNSSYLTLPFEGTLFHWKDVNGDPRIPIPWDVNVKINFKYRDLSLEILNAEIISENLVHLDINAMNIGLLDSAATNLDFYLNDPQTGSFIKQTNVTALSPGSYELFFDEEIPEEGWIYTTINRDKSIPECPGNNTASVYCANAPSTQYYVMDLWVWSQ